MNEPPRRYYRRPRGARSADERFEGVAGGHPAGFEAVAVSRLGDRHRGAAVVLGGTSLLGGRGTFIGTLMGAGLSVQVLNATVFLGLDQKWQYIFQGFLIVAAAIIYSQVRRGGSRTAGQP